MGTFGHWTCCLKTNYKDFCNNHKNYYHLACMNERCRPGKCRCKNCGNGCKYVGVDGHWSCCFKSKITSDGCDSD